MKKIILILMICILYSGLIAYIFGDVEGYVYDYTGIPLTDAYVRIVDLDIWTLSDFRGHYSFKDLPIGDYKVVFDHAKLGASISDSVTVEPLDIAFLDSRIHYYDSEDYPVEPRKPPKPRKKIRFVSSSNQKKETTGISTNIADVFAKPVQLKGMITGIVKDPLGEPVRFAQINIVELGIEAEADYDGRYSIEEIDPDLYTMIFSKDGYENRRYIGVMIKKGRAVTKNVTLRRK